MFGYKVLILCHLHSVVHIGIEPYIQQLFHAAAAIEIRWNQNNNYHAARTFTGSTDDTTKASVPVKVPNHVVHPSNEVEVDCDYHDDNNAYQTLFWLFRMGLDVTKIIRPRNESS
jgi:hypothetical protein